MGRAPCCDKHGVKKGAWTPEEDQILVDYIAKYGHGSWRYLPKLAGLLRCGKSCRLRWTNYLRPDIKRSPFTPEEENTIIQLHSMLGNRWASIASKLPGRTDNEVKNFWNTHLQKRLIHMGLNPQTHRPSSHSEPVNKKSESPSTRHMVQWESARVEAEARLSMESSLLSASSTSKTDCDYFLRIWNSEVGESFQKINGRGVVWQSPLSQTSSSTKFGSGSGVTMQAGTTGTSTSTNTTDKQNYRECKRRKPNTEDVMAGSDCSSPYEFDDSSDTSLKLLLDNPGGNDLGFLQGQSDNFSIFLNIKFD